MPSPWLVLHSPADHAAAVAALPGEGPLPIRTAVVSSERHAHVLRRELLRSGHGAILGGTRFAGATTLAREVLEDAGLHFSEGEEELRPARILGLLHEDIHLEYYDARTLRSTPGWPEALAGAISDLEGAGLEPGTLPATTGRWRDLQRLWARLDAAAGRSFTAARIHREAAARLSAGARPTAGPLLAAITGRESAALVRFLAALPGVRLALVAARPLRPRHLARVELLLGAGARRALEEAPLPPAVDTERDILCRYLFAPPDVLAEAGRPRSRGRDGTVELEEFSGVEDEVEAAAGWVAREVLERGTPLEEIAVLVPAGDGLAPLVASRIERLPWPTGRFPVHLAGGLPLVATAGGARALALARALRGHLPAGSLAEVLPHLRGAIGERAHLTHGEAMAVAWGADTVGGAPVHPEGALEWPVRLAAREEQAAARLSALAPEDDGRKGRELRDELELLRGARPAVEALCAVARLAVEERPLAELAPAFVDLLGRWMLDPGPGAPVHELLRDALAGDGAVAEVIAGADALALIEERIASLRLPTARFGSPAVHVGTLAGAAGLSFEAIRIVGLAEGALPSAVREDAVLPDVMRAGAGPLVPLSEDRVDGQLHAFDRAVRASRARLALSVPHSDLARSDRETSSLLVEVGAALWRPGGKEGSAIPDLETLRRTSFAPAREAASAFRDRNPVTDADWLDRACATGEIPPVWEDERPFALGRVLSLRGREGLGPADGILGPAGPFPSLPGLTPERPVSASRLEVLLGCPLRFLFQHVLGWAEPAGAPSVRELDALEYGSLLHAVVERFYAAHGADFVARDGTLARWREGARAIAMAELDALRTGRPLVGRGVVEKERSRLLRDVDAFLGYDWTLPLDRFVGVELPFDGVSVEAGEGVLHLRGRIDRIDVEEGHALVRDLKSGQAHPREGDEADPTPTRDVQLGLYSLVARQKAREWKLPARMRAAYVYPRSDRGRDFRGDHGALVEATRAWLGVARDLLVERSFPPSPSPDDCRYCPFAVTCGGQARASAALDGAGGATAAYLRLKRPPEEDGQ